MILWDVVGCLALAILMALGVYALGHVAAPAMAALLVRGGYTADTAVPLGYLLIGGPVVLVAERVFLYVRSRAQGRANAG